MTAGSIRERNGRFYVRTRVQVIDPETGEVRWKQVEKAAGSSKRQAQRTLSDRRRGRFGACRPTPTTDATSQAV